jgi:hypothetical protein
MTTRLYSSGRLVAYLTPITYFVKDQFLQDIELRIPVTEVLHTEYVSHPVVFDPPDGVPKTGYSEPSAQLLDFLSVNTTDGIPAQFSATRHQELNMRGRFLSPQQIHRFHYDWAEVIYTALSW